MIVQYAKDPVWANEQKTAINLTVKFEIFSDELPFTAVPDDVEQHGRELFSSAIAGTFGEIAEMPPKEVPPDIVGEEALNMIRQQRNLILEKEVDPIIMNPLRWADLTAEQQNEWATYRRALLDITTTYPNPSYVWNESEQRHVLTNCTFLTKP